MSDSQAPKINTTYNYGMFKLMKGNRKLITSHVKELKREMQRNPELLATNPILVNEHMFIIDGQHRYSAAMELKRQLFYIVSDGSTINQARYLNTTQRRWSLLDFAQSYADSGRADYVTFLELHKKYPLVSLTVLRLYLIGKQIHDIDGIFRRGDFEIFNLPISKHYLDKLNSIITTTHTSMNVPMAVSLLELMTKNDDFDIQLFLSKLERQSAQDLFQPQNSRRACMRSIEAVYNFQSKVQKRLY